MPPTAALTTHYYSPLLTSTHRYSLLTTHYSLLSLLLPTTHYYSLLLAFYYPHLLTNTLPFASKGVLQVLGE
jgi:hypothetical protein